MIDSRKSARITGILFLLGSLPPMAAGILWSPLVSSPDYLVGMAANSGKILLLALSNILFLGLACAGIGISLYPVLRRYGESLALAVAGFRLIEGALQIVGAFILLALLATSQECVKAGNPVGSYFQPVGAAIKTLRDWANNCGAVVAWCTAAFIYYGIFLRTRLVPRWLSIWGLLGLVAFLVSAATVLFAHLGSFSPAQMILALPILVQELVLAIWLIAKGYDE